MEKQCCDSEKPASSKTHGSNIEKWKIKDKHVIIITGGVCFVYLLVALSATLAGYSGISLLISILSFWFSILFLKPVRLFIETKIPAFRRDDSLLNTRLLLITLILAISSFFVVRYIAGHFIDETKFCDTITIISMAAFISNTLYNDLTE